MQVGPEERPEESSEPGKSSPRFNFGALTAVLSEPINVSRPRCVCAQGGFAQGKSVDRGIVALSDPSKRSFSADGARNPR